MFCYFIQEATRNFDAILKDVPVLDYLIIHFQIASFDASVSGMEIYID